MNWEYTPINEREESRLSKAAIESLASFLDELTELLDRKEGSVTVEGFTLISIGHYGLSLTDKFPDTKIDVTDKTGCHILGWISKK